MKTLQNVALAGYTSLRAGGPASTLIEVEAGDELGEIISSAEKPLLVLGYGTNCLIADSGWNGTVIINQRGTIQKTEGTRYKVDSGVNWDDFIQEVIADGLWGLEFTSGIPGGTGAAVAGNIAAYGHKIADCLVEAELLNTETGEIKTWSNADFEFDYRSSALHKPEKQKLVLLNATFELSREPTGELEYESALKVANELGVEPDSLNNRRQIIMEARARAGSLITDSDSGHHSAGSFFKNPVVNQEQVDKILSFEEQGITKEQLLHQNTIHTGGTTRVPAALVMLAAGFTRGQTWGNVRLHPDHILKVENTGQASAKEIYDVVQEIIGTVKDKLDIDLEPEVRLIGEF